MKIKTNQILQGDCIEEMKKLPENSIDAIITDPPYGLEFMGKEWDKFKEGKNIAGGTTGKDTPFGRSKPLNSVYQYTNEQKLTMQYFFEEWATQCLRVLKPGGFLLSLGGTRTYHRLVCGIEDAGFEIRDTIMWLYGSGFPKSLNIGKQMEKLQNADYEMVSKLILTGGKSDGEIAKYCKVSSALVRFWRLNERSIRRNEWIKLAELLKIEPKDYFIDAERDITGKDGRGELKEDMFFTQDNKKAFESGKSIGYGKWDLKDKPATPEAKEWEGWGTALKPACEPIVVARKPLSEKNVALNVLKWGTGGINIDECRIGTGENLGREQKAGPLPPEYGFNQNSMGNRFVLGNPQGRFPANIILDEEAGKMLPDDIEEYDEFKQQTLFGGILELENKSASRFFYCAKASKSERNLGCDELGEKHIDIQQPHNSKDLEERYKMTSKNNHPTVKPIKLMEYLIKLVSCKGAIVLDPFLGSGTTAIACLKQNRKFIGIEKEEEYVKIANARIKPFLEQRKLECNKD